MVTVHTLYETSTLQIPSVLKTAVLKGVPFKMCDELRTEWNAISIPNSL